jgi:hypothetical protein
MGDNAQSIYGELAYRPIRGMLLKLSYRNDMKYNSYAYLRVHRNENNQKVNESAGISNTLAQKPFDKCIYRNDELRLDGFYEVHPNMFLTLSLAYNNARGYDNLNENAIGSEDTGTEQYYLDKFSPLFYQGKNFTASLGFSFGF